MYLLASPCPQLYVEVDAVENCNPSEDTLNRLREFLQKYCNKPAGIEIVRSDVIPLAQARGVLPSTLARKYINGPPGRLVGAPPAFLYVLFYNDVQSDRPVVIETGHPGARAARRSRLANRNPHVDMLPYPAMIYMNVNWSPQSLHDAALLHEAGHSLGLAFRPENASGGHCLSRHCLMTKSFHLLPVLLGSCPEKQEQLCERCLAQLAINRTQTPPSNVRFVGPVLVRSESGYHVLSLPHRVKVAFGKLSEEDCQDFFETVHAEIPSPSDSEQEWHTEGSVNQELLRDPDKMREIVTRLAADPEWYVRRIAPRLWAICAQQYDSRGQFTNAVDACRQAILADSDCIDAHNLLAWIKATCPDESVRDGKEAVAAATKACQLSQWKERNWIDTLAAAWAEAGDFKRATRFQEQALRMGRPAGPEQNDMQARLSLYRQSLPFRQQH